MMEIIVVIALALIVLLASFTTLYYSGRSSAETRTAALRKQELLKQFHQIRFQLINLYQPEEGPALEGIPGVQARHNELYFVTTQISGGRGVGEVGYKIEKDYRGNQYLAVVEFPFPRNEDERFDYITPSRYKPDWKVASALIKEFQVEYEAGNQWIDRWDSEELPDRIRITFWYRENEEDEDPAELQKYQFVVVPGLKNLY